MESFGGEEEVVGTMPTAEASALHEEAKGMSDEDLEKAFQEALAEKERITNLPGEWTKERSELSGPVFERFEILSKERSSR